jgi:hypothetical protein
MTTEIPDSVLTAIKRVVAWGHGCDGPDDVGVDEILEYDLPVFENWLTKLGLLPPPERRA